METRDDAPSFTCSPKAGKEDDNGDDESAVSDQFLNRLDNIGLDLSMDIADLSALIDEKACAGSRSTAAAAAAAAVSTTSACADEGKI